MKITHLIGFFLFALSGAAQQKADSLRHELKHDLDDTTRVNLLIDLGREIIENEIDSTYKFALEADSLAVANNYSKGIMMTKNLLGNCAQRKGELDTAMHYYSIARQIAESTEDAKGMAIVLNNIGIISMNKGEYTDALESYLEAVAYEKIVGDKKGMAEGYNNIGVVHYYMGDMGNTLVYLKKSMELTKEIGDLQILKKGYINIGSIHLYREEYKEALDFYRKGLEVSEQLNDLTDITVCYHNIATTYTKMGKYKEAEKHYLEVLEVHRQNNDQRRIALDYTNLGSLFTKQRQYKKAQKYFKDAIDITLESGFRKILETAYAGLASCYDSLGQYQKAYTVIQKYTVLKDSLVNVENSKNFAELRTQYETAEKEKLLAIEKSRTDSLTAVNAVVAKGKAEAELSASNRAKWMILLAALVVGAILSSLMVMQRNKRKAQAEKDAAIIEERDRGTKAVFHAQENERKRISKDLHDGIGQQLSGLKMAFQKLGNEINKDLPEKSENIDQLIEVLNESADEVRSISHQMMPKVLTELGIIAAIEDMLAKSLGTNKIQYDFEHHNIQERLEERIEVSLYRIIQELINNIIKHSEAEIVNVQLFKNKGKIIMIVEDNGKGFKVDKKSDGHGLLNIKSRLNTINGEVNFDPSPTSGTIATIRIPIA